MLCSVRADCGEGEVFLLPPCVCFLFLILRLDGPGLGEGFCCWRSPGQFDNPLRCPNFFEASLWSGLGAGVYVVFLLLASDKSDSGYISYKTSAGVRDHKQGRG